MAPTNLIAWTLNPLRYLMSVRGFVKLNRTVVKITHFPLLAAIYFSESTMMRRSKFAVDATTGRNTSPVNRFKGLTEASSLLGTVTRRISHRSSFISSSHQQERVLEEVFARPYMVNSLNNGYNSNESSNNVDSWRSKIPASSPPPGHFTRDAHGNIMRWENTGPRGFRNTTHYTSTSIRDQTDPHSSTGLYHPHPFSENDHTIRTDDEDADNERHSIYGYETPDESTFERQPQTDEYPHGTYYSNATRSPRESEVLGSLPNDLPVRPKYHKRTSSTNTVVFSPVRRPNDSTPENKGRRRRTMKSASPMSPKGTKKLSRTTNSEQMNEHSSPESQYDNSELRIDTISSGTARMTTVNDTISDRDELLAKISSLEEGMKEIRDLLVQQQKKKAVRRAKKNE